jgi:hypothetical protein
MAFVARYRRRILTPLLIVYLILLGGMVYYVPIGSNSPLFRYVYPVNNPTGQVAEAPGISTLAGLLREHGCCFLDSKNGTAGEKIGIAGVPGEGNGSDGAAHQVLRQLAQVHAFYPAPPPMRLGRAGEIVFTVAAATPAVGTQSHLFGSKESSVSVLVSDQVSARLDGPGTDVSIALRGEDKQIVSPIGPTRWIWEVTPKAGGAVVLRLQLFAWVKIGDAGSTSSNEHKIEIKTAEIPIFVHVTAWEYIKILAGEIQPVWAAVAMVVGGIGPLLAWLRSRKKADGDKPKEGAPASTA